MKLIVVVSAAVLLSAILLPQWTSSTKINTWKSNSTYNDTDYDDMGSMVNYKVPIGTAMSVQHRTFPFLFNPLTVLAGLTISGALKIGILYSVCTWLLSIFFPTLGAGLYSGLGFGARSFDSSQFSNVTLPPSIASAISALQDKLNTIVPSIQQDDCKYRAVCETSSFINTKLPTVSDYMKQLSNTFLLNLANPYSRAWTSGMLQQDCSKLDFAPNCPVSPFATAAQSVSRYYSSFLN